MEHRLLTQPHTDSLQVTPVDLPYEASTRVHTSCAPGTQATTPWTLLEGGFNFNHTKDLLRLLRDRGALAGNRAGTAPSGLRTWHLVRSSGRPVFDARPFCDVYELAAALLDLPEASKSSCEHHE